MLLLHDSVFHVRFIYLVNGIWEIRMMCISGGICTTNGIRKKNLNLLFDLCRWQVEEEDTGAIRVALHLYLTSRPLLRPWVLQRLPLLRLMQLGVKGVQVTSNVL